MRQIPLALGPDPNPTFDTFLAGRNDAAVEHLQQLRAGDAPVLLWGESGSGKSHLLGAVAARLQAAGRIVAWFGPGQARPWQLPGDAAVVLLDDVHALDADEQAEAFRLFVEAVTQAVPVVAAGRCPPVDLPLRDDLRTRLGWGHVFELHALGEPEARAVLRREADRRGLLLSDEVMGYLMTRHARDLKSLMALLLELDTFGLATGRPVTLPLLRRLLAEQELPA
jgi:DnaA-homolog protein